MRTWARVGTEQVGDRWRVFLHTHECSKDSHADCQDTNGLVGPLSDHATALVHLAMMVEKCSEAGVSFQSPPGTPSA